MLDMTLTIRVAPVDYTEAIAAMLLLPAESIYWIDSKMSGKYESLTYQNMLTQGTDIKI